MRTISINEVIDNSRFNKFHLTIVIICSLISVFEGYDVGVIGSVIPEIMNQWHLTPIQAGAMASFALVGMIVGTLIFPPIADKIGRKNITILGILIFSLFMGFAAFTTSPTAFGIFRFLSGFGVGGVLPNLAALVTEYSPKLIRSRLVGIVMSAYSIGAMISAGLAIYLIPHFGWQPVLGVGIIPLLALPLLYKFMPESLNYYYMKNQQNKLTMTLQKIDPSYTSQKEDKYVAAITNHGKIPVMKLFENNRASSTFMIWIAYFMCLMLYYVTSTWLPKLMREIGYDLGSSLVTLMVLNLGGVLGGFLGSFLSDHWNGKKVVITFFCIASASIALLAIKMNFFLLNLVILIAGATTLGNQYTANAYVSQFYPSYMRSTGVGWALGVGRLGGILGPTITGIMLSLHVPFVLNFLVFVIPGIIGAIVISLVQDKHSDKQSLEVGELNQANSLNG